MRNQGRTGTLVFFGTVVVLVAALLAYPHLIVPFIVAGVVLSAIACVVVVIWTEMVVRRA